MARRTAGLMRRHGHKPVRFHPLAREVTMARQLSSTPATPPVYGAFTVPATALAILNEIRRAVTDSNLVTVFWLDDAGDMQRATGMARHVVTDDGGSFAWDWTEKSLLRLTATFETFIALGRIYSLHVHERGVSLQQARDTMGRDGRV